jgi:N-acetylneuraminate synthase
MRKKVRIGDLLVGDGEPCMIIAEIGINHNGSLEIAWRLIDEAVDAGCNAVKFQKRTVEVVYSPDELARPRESPFGTTNGDLKRALEFGQREYEGIDRYCKAKKIMWSASCWDPGSVEFVERFDPPFYTTCSGATG